MKIILLILCFAALTSADTYSQENFEYPLGDSLYQHWSSTGPIFMGPYKRILITNPTLSFPSYYGSNLGYSAMIDTVDIEVLKKSFSFMGTSAGSIYTSFIVRVGAARFGGGRFINIGGAQFSNFNYNSGGGVFVKDSAGKLAFGIAKHSEAPVYTPAIYNRATNYLVIHKYTYVPGSETNDSLGLFVFSDECPFDEPAPNVAIAPSGSDFPAIGTVWLYQKVNESNSPRLKIDGIAMQYFWNNNLLPVELTTFNTAVKNSDVILNWTTGSEVNNSGFDIERSSNGNLWNQIGFVKGSGTINSAVNYTFTDKNLPSGTYNYRIKQIDFNGNYEYYELTDAVSVGIPEKYYLSQNYPNPFNPVTNINFELPEDKTVTIRIYDISGRVMKTILNELKSAGYYKIQFNTSDLASGLYFYKMSAGEFLNVKKMIVIK